MHAQRLVFDPVLEIDGCLPFSKSFGKRPIEK